ncbi:MAG TPA: pseudouridine synthase [Steroidobacteraceae bacterium]|nr:pseudouridine synthase [Steroidobacteraceae bacterium]
MRLILVNKPFRVMTAFRSSAGHRTLADLLSAPGCHPAGRLDHDSEGLLLLTDDGALQARLSHPRFKLPKSYFAQVEGEPDAAALARLATGVRLGDGPTLPAQARRVPEPGWLWPRDPPIRYRREIPTTWIELVLQEGRNRQVRRMTAAVGHPTLRLIRWSVGPLSLAGLAPGAWREASAEEIALVQRSKTARARTDDRRRAAPLIRRRSKKNG